ncbi:MAG TPA: hypothetical protein VIV40_28535, partial [Kofleriaceae bacterium]
MDGRFVLGLLLLGACKAEIADGPPDGGKQPDGGNPKSPDAAGDGQSPLGPWGTPTKVPGADTAAEEDDATLSSTRLELYFKRLDTDNTNLYEMTRATPTS